MGFANEHRAKEQSAAEHKAQEYEALRESVESLRKEIKALGRKLDSKSEPSVHVAAMDDEDRKLMLNIYNRLGDVRHDVNTVHASYKYLFFVVTGFALASIAFGLWTQVKTRNYMEQVQIDYRSTTAILSGEERYWFDGENYHMGQESPTNEEYRQIMEKIQLAKAQREQTGQE